MTTHASLMMDPMDTIDPTGGDAPLRVLGIAGSLRGGSMNRKLLEAARELLPPGVELDVFDLAGIPLYNSELDTDAARPARVEELKRAIAAADALLVSTPEYNSSVPGVLQNAIDWASRPAMKSPLAGKPVGVVGVSPGAHGAVRAQQQLKLVLMSTLALVLPHPGVAVGQVHEKFDASGRLVHEPTRQFFSSFLRDLQSWTLRTRSPAASLVAA